MFICVCVCVYICVCVCVCVCLCVKLKSHKPVVTLDTIHFHVCCLLVTKRLLSFFSELRVKWMADLSSDHTMHPWHVIGDPFPTG